MGRIMQRVWNFLGFAEDGEEDERPGPTPGPRAPVLNLHTQRTMEIVVLEPGAYEEAQTAADYLKTHRPIVVDLLSGVTYALDGHMHRVGDEIFLFTPHHVVVTAEHFRQDAALSPLFPME